MLTLNQLKPIRVARTIPRLQLAETTAIDPARLRLLELRKAEPWLDEAVLLSYALCTKGIVPLITSGDLTNCPDPLNPVSTATAIKAWHMGARLPLSAAITLCKAFGLPDPVELSTRLLHQQIWAVLERNERARSDDARFFCPWCAADLFPSEEVPDPQHLPTCLPNNLWGARGVSQAAPDEPILVLRAEHAGTRAKGKKAYGLKELREKRGLSQKEVAYKLDIAANHYARLERSEVNLTSRLADHMAQLFEVDKALLFVVPPEILAIVTTPAVAGLGDA